MTPEELQETRELLMSLINDVIKPVSHIAPSDDEERVLYTVMNTISVHVPKLLDEIERLRHVLNELEDGWIPVQWLHAREMIRQALEGDTK